MANVAHKTHHTSSKNLESRISESNGKERVNIVRTKALVGLGKCKSRGDNVIKDDGLCAL